MTETPYPFTPNRWERSFLSIFQDSSSQRSIFSSSSLVLGSLYSGILEDDEGVDDDDKLLSFLPGDGRYLTPKAKAIVQNLTEAYIYGEKSDVAVPTTNDVLVAVDADYKCSDVPVEVGDQIFDFKSSGLGEHRRIVRVLSFALECRLPAAVTSLLLEENSYPNDSFKNTSLALIEEGWRSVTFPRGLAIRKQRRLLGPEKYVPIPRKWITSSMRARVVADRKLDEASKIDPPPQQRMTKEEFLESMDQTLSATNAKKQQANFVQNALAFFPRQAERLRQAKKRGNFFQDMIRYVMRQFSWLKSRISAATQRQATLLDKTGNAGVVANRLLITVWYVVASIYLWRRLFVRNVGFFANVYAASGLRLSAVIAGSFLTCRMLQFPLLAMSRLTVPLGNQLLKRSQNRSDSVSEEDATKQVSRRLLLLRVSVWAALFAWSIFVAKPELTSTPEKYLGGTVYS